jgi:hypothetical protein
MQRFSYGLNESGEDVIKANAHQKAVWLLHNTKIESGYTFSLCFFDYSLMTNFPNNSILDRLLVLRRKFSK